MTRPPSPAIPEAAPAAAPPPVRTARTRPRPAAPETSLILGPVDTAPGTARATLKTALTLWGLRHVSDDGEAITSELVANAVAASIQGAQARGVKPPPVMLRITARDGELCIRVWDPDPTPPPRDQDAPDDDAENGRGLLIVAALASRWGWHHDRSGGKHVWATLPLDARPAEEQQRDRP